jgi:predicted RNA-binding protein associated with RNAse of E/G family
MVSVTKERKLWKAKDLYIDFIVKGDGRYYVVDIDEFNEAIIRKELKDNDVSDALNGLDNILKGYYETHDLEHYINSLREQYSDMGKLIISKKTA